MNRILLGIIFGVTFGAVDVLMTVFGNHPERTTGMLLQAFFSRFAIGLLAGNVNLRMPQILAGVVVGLLISLPDAFALNAYVGILGTGLAVWRDHGLGGAEVGKLARDGKLSGVGL